MSIDAIHFNRSCENVLAAMAPNNAPTGYRTFPAGIPNEEARIQDQLNVLDWVRDVHQRIPERYRHHFAITPKLCFVADIRWSSHDGTAAIDEVHCQAAVALKGSFENLPDTRSLSAGAIRYLRLDFEPANLGTYVFPDSVPHVHAVTKGEPRFPVSIHPSAPHVDFLELLVRNFFRQDWDAWAANVWRARVASKFPGESKHYDLLERIRVAFRENRHRELCTAFSESVLAWKMALHDEKRRMFELGRNRFYDAIDY